MAELGSFALLFAFILSLYASVAAFIGGWRRSQVLVVTAERAVLAVCALFTIAVYALTVLLVKSDFSMEYVANYTNLNLPIFYKISALWAGHDGSLLFWSWLLSIYSAIVVIQYRKKMRELMPYVIAVLMGNGVFFSFLNYFISTPFSMLGIQGADGALQFFSPEDGQGLNPLLQHPAMIIHPPMLYFGFVGFAVPFAFAIAAMITGNLGGAWFKATRLWTLFSWLFLSAGIFLGCKWAYVELGWGGYWSWDPVENASLMPWLTGTAFIHSTMIQEKRGMLKKWNMALILLTYILCIFGTFLTRSGIVSSVHAFAGSSIGPLFAGFISIVTIICTGLFLYRLPFLKSENRLDSMLSRESGFLFNNLIFLAACFAVFWGTMFPVLSEAVEGVKISVGPPFFNKVIIPLGLLLLFLTAVGPLFAWRRTSLVNLRRNFLIPGTGAVIVAGILLASGILPGYPLISFTLAAFVVLIVVLEFHKGAVLRARQIGKPYYAALVNMIRRSTRRYGSHIVHFSVALAFVGMTGSVFKAEVRKEAGVGDSFSVRNYTFAVSAVSHDRTPNYMVSKVSMTLLKNGEPTAVLEPEKRFYFASEQTTSEVRIYSTLLEDVYTVFSGFDKETEKALIRVHINPLMMWFWIASIGLVMGTILIMIPDKRHRLRAVSLQKQRVTAYQESL